MARFFFCLSLLFLACATVLLYLARRKKRVLFRRPLKPIAVLTSALDSSPACQVEELKKLLPDDSGVTISVQIKSGVDVGIVPDMLRRAAEEWEKDLL